RCRAGPGQVADRGAGTGRGAGGVLPHRVPVRVLEARAGAGAGRVPAGPQLGQGQVGGELAAAVPDRLAVPAGVAGQRYRVPGDLPRGAGAVPQPDHHPSALQLPEVSRLAGGGRSGGRGVPPQGDPRRFAPALPDGFLVLSPGRPPGGGPVARRGRGQPVPLLSGVAGAGYLVEVPPDGGFRAVLAGEHRDDVHVVIGVPDRDPAHRLVFLPARAQAGAVHHVRRGVGPLTVGEHLVSWRGPHRAQAHRPFVATVAERVVGLA